MVSGDHYRPEHANMVLDVIMKNDVPVPILKNDKVLMAHTKLLKLQTSIENSSTVDHRRLGSIGKKNALKAADERKAKKQKK